MAKGIRVASGTHQKTPDEVTAFSLTYAHALADGETVSSVIQTGITVDGTTGLAIDSTQVQSPLVNVVVSGGAAGSRYFVEIRVSTNLGQTLEGVVKVVVSEQTTVASFLLVQDDSGTTADANGYITVAYFRTHCLQRCRSVDAYDEDQMEAAIVCATDYLDTRFRFKGEKLNQSQTTQWPRRDAKNRDGYYENGIPLAIQKATAEYAYVALTSNDALSPTPTRDETGQVVSEKKEKVGPIETTYKYAGGASSFEMPRYPTADSQLHATGLTITGIDIRRA